MPAILQTTQKLQRENEAAILSDAERIAKEIALAEFEDRDCTIDAETIIYTFEAANWTEEKQQQRVDQYLAAFKALDELPAAEKLIADGEAAALELVAHDAETQRIANARREARVAIVYRANRAVDGVIARDRARNIIEEYLPLPPAAAARLAKIGEQSAALGKRRQQLTNEALSPMHPHSALGLPQTAIVDAATHPAAALTQARADLAAAHEFAAGPKLAEMQELYRQRIATAEKYLAAALKERAGIEDDLKALQREAKAIGESRFKVSAK